MLSDEQILNNKVQFIAELKKINRDGIDNLINWLQDPNQSDFFTAPASTIYHGNYKGGLCEHSLHVYQCALKIRDMYNQLCLETGKHALNVTDEQLRICALLHDVCKIGYYTIYERNYKDDEDGQWHKAMAYKVEDQLPLGHGDKSVMLIQRFVMLHAIEMLAIRWHMGFSELAVRIDPSYSKPFNKAFDGRYPLVVIIHLADSMASFMLDDMVNLPWSR